ncbi:hypothetical protein [Limimaricola cinnabarinus]|uniref:hypothetical protein n=1 Tax=Limimaricola cinnabarinus TaxID=1125964 RepID=UPI0013A64D5F|nr:hypothetical protein [Limimaricola cinnabarinus]
MIEVAQPGLGMNAPCPSDDHDTGPRANGQAARSGPGDTVAASVDYLLHLDPNGRPVSGSSMPPEGANSLWQAHVRGEGACWFQKNTGNLPSARYLSCQPTAMGDPKW